MGQNKVFFTTGIDEHGTTVEKAARKAGFETNNIQEYVDQKANEWEEAFSRTNISYDYFVRTTDQKHERFAQTFIQKLIDNGDVYKDTYTGKYCWGCEKFLTASDMNEHGLCAIHRPEQVEEIKEENYFFRLSKYAPRIKELINNNDLRITPENKKSELISRIDEGVDDLSISRPRKKVGWAVDFPGDPDQTVYVWVEALINYLSSLSINKKEKYWDAAVHVLGKDISWFHNVIWPAFLLSAGYSVFKSSFVHSFLLVSGQKISKSLGNVISPEDLTKKFGIDGSRYLIIKNLPYRNDSNITWMTLNKIYEADLANGIGNLVARVAAMAEKEKVVVDASKIDFSPAVKEHIQNYQLNLALEDIWNRITALDKYINENEVWTLAGKQKQEAMVYLVDNIRQIAHDLQPFMPETAQKIRGQFKGPEIKKLDPLFPRLKK